MPETIASSPKAHRAASESPLKRPFSDKRTPRWHSTQAFIIGSGRKETAVAKYTAREIAHYVIDTCTRDGRPISNLQLQKILYFVQLEYCKQAGSLLFADEFEAWQYGPVLPDVYDEYSFFGGMRVEKTYASVAQPAPEDKLIIDKVVVDKREKYPWDLVRIAHASGSPWDRAFRKGNGTVIPNSSLLAFCKE